MEKARSFRKHFRKKYGEQRSRLRADFIRSFFEAIYPLLRSKKRKIFAFKMKWKRSFRYKKSFRQFLAKVFKHENNKERYKNLIVPIILHNGNCCRIEVEGEFFEARMKITVPTAIRDGMLVRIRGVEMGRFIVEPIYPQP